jgi:hypothetical protein
MTRTILSVTTVGDLEGSGSSNNHCYVTYYVHGACLGPNLKQCGALFPQVAAHKSSPPVMQTATVALFRTFLTPITAYLRFLPLDLSRVSLLARHFFNINNVMNQILPRRICWPGSEPSHSYILQCDATLSERIFVSCDEVASSHARYSLDIAAAFLLL